MGLFEGFLENPGTPIPILLNLEFSSLMVRFAHFSDVHISNVPGTLLKMWWGKRLLGGANMLLVRRRHMLNANMPLLVEHVMQQNPDAVLITGDLSTTALNEEFAQARELLKPIHEAVPMVTIPGNHDIYTPGVQRERRYEKHFADFHGDSQEDSGYPFVRELGGGVVCVGLNSCVPTGITGAWGIVSDEQLSRLPEILDAHQEQFRIVLVHHFLEDKHGTPGLPHRGIRNRDDLLKILEQHGAELVLHGHEHACYQYTIPGKGNLIPVLNAGPATFQSEKPNKQAGYQLYDIEAGVLQRVVRFGLQPDQTWTERDITY